MKYYINLSETHMHFGVTSLDVIFFIFKSLFTFYGAYLLICEDFFKNALLYIDFFSFLTEALPRWNWYCSMPMCWWIAKRTGYFSPSIISSGKESHQPPLNHLSQKKEKKKKNPNQAQPLHIYKYHYVSFKKILYGYMNLSD